MSVHLSLARAAQVNPGGAAVIVGRERRNWRQFADRVARRARALRERLGLAPGELIAVIASNVPEHVEIAYASFWAELVLVPINWRLSQPEQVQILKHAGCTAIVSDRRYAERAQALAQAAGGLRADVLTPIAEWDRAGDPLAGLDALPLPQTGPMAPAAIFYTGGTTGLPKGVELSHLSLLVQGLNTSHEARFDASTVYMHAAPLFHLGDFAAGLAVTTTASAHTFLPEFSPEAVLDSIEHEGTNVLMLVPTMIPMLLDAAGPRKHLLDRVRTVLYGAAPIQEPVLRRMMAELPTVGLIQMYGQTEVGGACTVLQVERHVLEGPLAGKTNSAGHPTATFLMRVTDDDGRELPPGQPGEISVRGPGMMLGYWKDPQLTEATIRDGWLHTGDIGIFDEDGFVTIAGRLKDMIITGGENVFAGEVESALMYHPAVAEAAVIGVPDPKWGETVHAVVVPKPGAAPDPQALIAHCRTLIAGYKCPRTVEIRRASLPLSGVGKVRKNELREEWNEAHKGASNVVQ